MPCRVVCCGLLLVGWVAVAQAEVRLQRKVFPLAEQASRMERKLQETLTIGGNDVEVSSFINARVQTKTGTRGADGAIRIDQKFTGFQAEFNIVGNKAAFDLGNPNQKAENAGLQFVVDIYRTAAQTPWTLVLDAENALHAVDYRAELPMFDNPDLTALVKEVISAERIKVRAAQEFDRLPSGPIVIGDSWTRTETAHLEAAQVLTMEKRYVYEGPIERDGKQLDKVTITPLKVSYSFDPPSTSVLKVITSVLQVKEGNGVLLFDREHGFVVEVGEKLRIQGDLNFSINGEESSGKLDLSLTTLEKVD